MPSGSVGVDIIIIQEREFLVSLSNQTHSLCPLKAHLNCSEELSTYPPWCKKNDAALVLNWDKKFAKMNYYKFFTLTLILKKNSNCCFLWHSVPLVLRWVVSCWQKNPKTLGWVFPKRRRGFCCDPSGKRDGLVDWEEGISRPVNREHKYGHSFYLSWVCSFCGPVHQGVVSSSV